MDSRNTLKRKSSNEDLRTTFKRSQHHHNSTRPNPRRITRKDFTDLEKIIDTLLEPEERLEAPSVDILTNYAWFAALQPNQLKAYIDHIDQAIQDNIQDAPDSRQVPTRPSEPSPGVGRSYNSDTRPRDYRNKSPRETVNVNSNTHHPGESHPYDSSQQRSPQLPSPVPDDTQHSAPVPEPKYAEGRRSDKSSTKSKNTKASRSSRREPRKERIRVKFERVRWNKRSRIPKDRPVSPKTIPRRRIKREKTVTTYA
ncbi:hypothetical protein F4677DRAFT_466141 [Hypoxylon crocopeplum]|nr:hypothetical protein F4677DRAFT_466141 [Hypoxylon crocopeplum]